jgi:hypothetical protein
VGEGGHIKGTYKSTRKRKGKEGKEKKRKEKKVIINHIYDAVREPAFERMDDR